MPAPKELLTGSRTLKRCECCINRAELAGTPFHGPAPGDVLRTLGPASWTFSTAEGGLQRKCKSPQLAWLCQQRAAKGSCSNTPRQEAAAVPSSSVGHRRAISTRSPKMAAVPGGGAAGEGVTFVTSDHAMRRNADPGAVAFVTGGNRGIGLELTRQLLAKVKGERERLNWGTKASAVFLHICSVGHRYATFSIAFHAFQ